MTIRRVSAIALLVLVLLGVLRTMDSLSGSGPRPAAAVGAAPAPPAALHPGTNRVFLLMVDSLRWETSQDPEIMPYLVALQDRGARSKALSSRDAVTVSALRAAFTGRDEFSVFGFVENFWRGDAGVESLFSQAAAAGVKTAIYSEGSFDQFGKQVADFRSHNGPGEGREEQQNAALDLALADYLSGRHDFVVFHLTYGDHFAHKVGIRGDGYAQAFGAIDDQIEKLDLAIPRTDTLVVMGDHGHDARGRHLLGLDIPTLTLYRGPAFAPGEDLGLTSVTEHRYLASWALGLPLSPAYSGGRHPAALVPLGAPPPAYAAAFDPLAKRARRDTQTQEDDRRALLVTAGYVGLLGWLWLGYLRRRDEPLPLSAHVGLWVAAAPLAVPHLGPWNAVVGVGLSLAWLLRFGPAWMRERRALLLGALFAAACVGLERWGFFLAAHRARIHDPSYYLLGKVWVGAAGAGLVLSLVAGPMVAGFVLLGVTALLCFPTVYRYGAMATMAPLWASWALFVVVHTLFVWLRRLRSDRPAARRTVLSVPASIALGAALFAILGQFWFVYGQNLHFSGWNGIFREPTRNGWMLLALACKLAIFVRPRSSRWAIAASLVTVAFLAVVERGYLPLVGWKGALAIGVFGAAALARRRLPEGLDRVAVLGLLWVVRLYSIRVQAEAPAWGDCFLGALVLSAWLARHSADPRAARHGQLFLLMLSLIATGWMTLGWTAYHFEWAFLYDFLPAELVERHVAAFLPLILLRYVIPIVTARRLLADAFDGAPPVADPLRLAGLKFLGLSMLVIGIGSHSVAGDVYLESVEELTIVALLMLGFAFGFPTDQASSRARSVEPASAPPTPLPEAAE